MVPEHMALAFAAHILFMKSAMGPDGGFYGSFEGESYRINDENASYYFGKWQQATPGKLVPEILANEKLWGTNLAESTAFVVSVEKYLTALLEYDTLALIEEEIR